MTDALARDLAEADPDRHVMAMLAPIAARARLVTLYALNLELARTALAAREPALAEIRVQWWVEHLSDMARAAPPPHELLTPLYEAWGPQAATLVTLAEGRRRDVARQPFQTVAEVCAYVQGTAGALMDAAARAVAMPDAAAATVAAQAQGAGLAAWLAAEPRLVEWNLGLADPALRADLAKAGLDAFAEANRRRRSVPRAFAPVLFAGAGAGKRLRALAAGAHPVEPSPFARRAALLRLGIAGRWWVTA